MEKKKDLPKRGVTQRQLTTYVILRFLTLRTLAASARMIQSRSLTAFEVGAFSRLHRPRGETRERDNNLALRRKSALYRTALHYVNKFTQIYTVIIQLITFKCIH